MLPLIATGPGHTSNAPKECQARRQGVISEPHPGVWFGDLGNRKDVVHTPFEKCKKNGLQPEFSTSQRIKHGVVAPENRAWASKDRPARRPRPFNMASRDMRSKSPIPSIDKTVVRSSRSVNAWSAWAMHSSPARVVTATDQNYKGPMQKTQWRSRTSSRKFRWT